jgi:hypothetical protein
MQEFSVISTLDSTDPDNDTLYIRVFPWNASGATSTGKYLAIYGLKVDGISGE